MSVNKYDNKSSIKKRELVVTWLSNGTQQMHIHCSLIEIEDLCRCVAFKSYGILMSMYLCAITSLDGDGIDVSVPITFEWDKNINLLCCLLQNIRSKPLHVYEIKHTRLFGMSDADKRTTNPHKHTHKSNHQPKSDRVWVKHKCDVANTREKTPNEKSANDHWLK